MNAATMQAISSTAISVAFACIIFGNIASNCCAAAHIENIVECRGFEISELIEKLDSQKFKDRERATEQLVAFGDKALHPIAGHFFDASPEAAWRIKRILQEIGTESANEETSLKAIGVLMVLDHKVDGELAGLIETWRTNRSQRAIRFLVDKGASTSRASLQRQFLIRQPVIRILSSKNEIQNPLRKKTKPKLDRSTARKKINSLVNGSFAEVQKFVFQSIPASDPTNSLIDDDFAFRAAIRGIGVAGEKSAPTFLEIGNGWKGTSNDLLRMKEIHSLYGVRFKEQTLQRQDIETISQLAHLRHFGFVNSQLRSSNLSSIDLPVNVNSIEIQRQAIDSNTIDWMARWPLSNLTIENCKINTSGQKRFSKLVDLVSLDLRRIEVDMTLFNSLQEMSNLQYVFLSVCKFDPQDCRDFDRVRPRVIQFNPVSFLGVQGTRDARQPGSFSCEIEMVVPDSGADRAGVKPGDIITAVNEDEIQTFTELRMFISQFDIGESMKLKVMRGDKELTLSATLGANPNLIPR